MRSRPNSRERPIATDLPSATKLHSWRGSRHERFEDSLNETSRSSFTGSFATEGSDASDSEAKPDPKIILSPSKTNLTLTGSPKSHALRPAKQKRNTDKKKKSRLLFAPRPKRPSQLQIESGMVKLLIDMANAKELDERGLARFLGEARASDLDVGPVLDSFAKRYFVGKEVDYVKQCWDCAAKLGTLKAGDLLTPKLKKQIQNLANPKTLDKIELPDGSADTESLNEAIKEFLKQKTIETEDVAKMTKNFLDGLIERMAGASCDLGMKWNAHLAEIAVPETIKKLVNEKANGTMRKVFAAALVIPNSVYRQQVIASLTEKFKAYLPEGANNEFDFWLECWGVTTELTGEAPLAIEALRVRVNDLLTLSTPPEDHGLFRKPEVATDPAAAFDVRSNVDKRCRDKVATVLRMLDELETLVADDSTVYVAEGLRNEMTKKLVEVMNHIGGFSGTIGGLWFEFTFKLREN